MTDKELLELAAKAAGIEGKWSKWHQAYGDQWVEGIDIGQPILWNPLTDDGDALRLLVNLKLNIEQDFDLVEVFKDGKLMTEFIYEKPTLTDRYAATRRAIVCAAAEIGKTK